MAEASNVWMVLALCTAVASASFFATREYYLSQVQDAQDAALRLRNENEKLVEQKTKAIAERDDWQRLAKTERDKIYEQSPAAKEWRDTPVPTELAHRVRSAALGVDAAAREYSEREGR